MGLVILIRNGDGLKEHDTLGSQSIRADAEERIEVIASHRFDHLQRDEFVVVTRQIPVILEQDFNAVRKARLGDPLRRACVLLTRNRRRRHPAAAGRGRVKREAPPTRTDFEHVVLGAQIQLVTDAFVLRDRSLLHRRVVGYEDSTRISERGVEEEREEFVTEIVMGRNVPPAA